jgi:hypothetical protein
MRTLKAMEILICAWVVGALTSATLAQITNQPGGSDNKDQQPYGVANDAGAPDAAGTSQTAPGMNAGPIFSGLKNAQSIKAAKDPKQRMIQRLKNQLGCTPDEFAQLEPRIQAVLNTRETVMITMSSMESISHAAPGAVPTVDAHDNPTRVLLRQAIVDLGQAIADPSSAPEAVKSKLNAVQVMVAKAKEEWAAAKADLRALVTQRQEAILFLHGVLN